MTRHDVNANPYAPPDVELDDVTAGEPFEGFLGYAGFWRRVIAFILDYFTIVTFLLSWPTVIQLIQLPLRMMGAPDDLRALTTFAAFLLFTVVAPIVYFAGCESSPFQATLGKWMIGIKVTSLHGRRISFLHALGRLCGKFLSALILYVGFVMVAFTSRKQGLHDVLAATLVVRSR
ncbi:MAG: RDD family protein [Isosphaeraceae bacterium]